MKMYFLKAFFSLCVLIFLFSACKKEIPGLTPGPDYTSVDRTYTLLEYNITQSGNSYFVFSVQVKDMTQFGYDQNPIGLSHRNQLRCNGINLIFNEEHRYYYPETDLPIDPNGQYIVEWEEEGAELRVDTLQINTVGFPSGLDTIDSNNLPYQFVWQGAALGEEEVSYVHVFGGDPNHPVSGRASESSATSFQLDTLPADIARNQVHRFELDWISRREWRKGEHGARKAFFSYSTRKDIFVR